MAKQESFFKDLGDLLFGQTPEPTPKTGEWANYSTNRNDVGIVLDEKPGWRLVGIGGQEGSTWIKVDELKRVQKP